MFKQYLLEGNVHNINTTCHENIWDLKNSWNKQFFVDKLNASGVYASRQFSKGLMSCSCLIGNYGTKSKTRYISFSQMSNCLPISHSNDIVLSSFRWKGILHDSVTAVVFNVLHRLVLTFCRFMPEVKVKYTCIRNKLIFTKTIKTRSVLSSD